MAENKQWYVICYDITEPKRWRKVYKLVNGYGRRLQYSIFRCRLTPRRQEKLRWELDVTRRDNLPRCSHDSVHRDFHAGFGDDSANRSKAG